MEKGMKSLIVPEILSFTAVGREHHIVRQDHEVDQGDAAFVVIVSASDRAKCFGRLGWIMARDYDELALPDPAAPPDEEDPNRVEYWRNGHRVRVVNNVTGYTEEQHRDDKEGCMLSAHVFLSPVVPDDESTIAKADWGMPEPITKELSSVTHPCATCKVVAAMQAHIDDLRLLHRHEITNGSGFREEELAQDAIDIDELLARENNPQSAIRNGAIK